jgi:ribosomal protein S18 acetylase RimI-like enzyme
MHDGQAHDGAVREATEADVDAVAAFFRAAWREAGPDAPGFAGATDEVMEELASHEVLSERIVGEGRHMYVAVVDAAADPDVVGFAATRAIDDAAIELAGIVVRRAYAGRGLGSALVDIAIRRSAPSYRTMIVRTETTNAGARAFYERCGFRVTGTAIEDVDGRSVEVWELERPLDA